MSNGAEAAVYAARLFLWKLGLNEVVLELDFKNAFNSVQWDKMLAAVQKFEPNLLPFIHSSYSSQSFLFWNDKVIKSYEGVQQGDPLGPLLFCLIIYQISLKLKSQLCLLYLDDVTMGGKVEDVLHDLEVIKRDGEELGLILNGKKSEIISGCVVSSNNILSCLPDAHIVPPAKATLLGSPIGDVNSISDITKRRFTS